MSSVATARATILVVDDEETNRTTLAKVFREEGFEVRVSATPSEALDLLASEPPDLLLLDVNLGNESGLDLLRTVKADPKLGYVFVVMITGHLTSSNDQALGLELGADGYLVRPIERRPLVARVHAFLRHKRSIDALRRSELRFRKIIDRNPDAILVVDRAGQIRFANPASETLFRITADELLSRTFGFPIVSGEHTEIQVLRHGDQSSYAEMRTIDIDWDEGDSFLTSVRDITDRKHVEAALAASEQRYRTLFEHAGDGILIHDDNGAIVDVNQAYCALMGYDKTEFVTKHLRDLHPSEVVWDELATREFTKLHSGGMTSFETKFVAADGRVFEGEISTKRLDIGERPLYLAVIRDVSERARSREELERELDEKRVLLRELYHRTKNNMQVISSMLALKQRTLSDFGASQGFDDVNNRILAMSLVHEKLYESKNLSRLNFSDYLASLASLLEYSLADKERELKIETHASDHMALIDIAVPLGQIITELVTNSVKHGFVDKAKGTITISVEEVEPQVLEIDYCDDGGGFPADFEITRDANMGLETVRLMVEDQLRGSIRVIPHNGARLRMRVKESSYETRV